MSWFCGGRFRGCFPCFIIDSALGTRVRASGHDEPATLVEEMFSPQELRNRGFAAGSPDRGEVSKLPFPSWGSKYHV